MFIALSLIGCGLLALGYVAHCMIFARRVRRWPITEGTVAQTRILERTDGDGDVQYHRYISYTYCVGDRRYGNDRVGIGPSVRPSSIVLPPPAELSSVAYREAAAALEQEYPPGAVVQVHYNPAAPQQSVVDPTVRGAVVFIGGLALLALLFGVGILSGSVSLVTDRASP